MNKFVFLYKGFVPPTPEIGRSWMEWFSQVGDSMADSGNPMTGGVEVTPDKVNEIELGNRLVHRLLDRERREHGGRRRTGEDESNDHERRCLRVGPDVAMSTKAKLEVLSMT
jgi:hypothetical protein